MEYDKNNFINNLNILMKENRIKISELESECNLSQGYFSRFKSSNENAAPNINLITKLCSIFNVSINTLLFTDCGSICKQEKSILNFIDKLCDKTYEDEIHWRRYSLLSDHEDIINSGLTSLLIPREDGFGFKYTSKFPFFRYLDENSSIYSYKNGNEYYVLCNIRDNNVYDEHPILELYYIKNNELYTICESEESNLFISEKLHFLYACILKEQKVTRIDDCVLDAINKF